MPLDRSGRNVTGPLEEYFEIDHNAIEAGRMLLSHIQATWLT